MKLRGSIGIHVRGQDILRRPTVWDKIRRQLGGEPDLRTGRVAAALEASALVQATREALSRLEIDNAISLVIDDQVLFQDRDGRKDDLGDLMFAFLEHDEVFGREFRMLRLAVEHEEAGLHCVLEIVAQTEHPANEPAARVIVSGRLRDLEPRFGEDADAYRSRVEPLTRDAARLELHRHQFESYVERVEQALQAAMPEARVEIERARAELERPSRRKKQPAQPRATDRHYDPYQVYYPSPLDGILSAMMWTSVFSMAMRPDIVVVNEHGESLGSAADLTGSDGSGLDDVGGDADVGDGGDMGFADGGDMDGGFFDGFDF